MQRFVESNLLSNFIVWGNSILGMGKEKKMKCIYRDSNQLQELECHCFLSSEFTRKRMGRDPALPPAIQDWPFQQTGQSRWCLLLRIPPGAVGIAPWANICPPLATLCTVSAWAGLQSLGQVGCFVTKLIIMIIMIIKWITTMLGTI